jgi:hypothetical protein
MYPGGGLEDLSFYWNWETWRHTGDSDGFEWGRALYNCASLWSSASPDKWSYICSINCSPSYGDPIRKAFQVCDTNSLVDDPDIPTTWRAGASEG